MKKIFILMTAIVIVIISIGCSKDHSAPTFAQYVQPKPSNVAVVYNADDETAAVTWNMNDVTDVVGFQLSVTDSLGHISFEKTTGQATNHIMNVKDKFGTFNIKVGAIFNSETLNNFYGPVSDDSAILIIESE